MKKIEKETARQLRSLGRSIKSIAGELNVSPGSVSRWVSDVELTQDQLKTLDEQNPSKKAFKGKRVGYDFIADVARRRRGTLQECGRLEVGAFSLHLAGCMIYWAEGSKDKNTIKVTNYDPDMLVFFVRFLRECYCVPNEKIKIHIAHYSDEKRLVNEDFWLGILALPRTCLGNTKTIVSNPKMKTNRHEFGGCTITVNNTEILHKIYGSIKEYIGIKDDRWLG